MSYPLSQEPEQKYPDDDYTPSYIVPPTKINDEVDSEDMETAAKVLEKLPDETNLPE